MRLLLRCDFSPSPPLTLPRSLPSWMLWPRRTLLPCRPRSATPLSSWGSAPRRRWALAHSPPWPGSSVLVVRAGRHCRAGRTRPRWSRHPRSATPLSGWGRAPRRRRAQAHDPPWPGSSVLVICAGRSCLLHWCQGRPQRPHLPCRRRAWGSRLRRQPGAGCTWRSGGDDAVGREKNGNIY